MKIFPSAIREVTKVILKLLNDYWYSATVWLWFVSALGCSLFLEPATVYRGICIGMLYSIAAIVLFFVFIHRNL